MKDEAARVRPSVKETKALKARIVELEAQPAPEGVPQNASDELKDARELLKQADMREEQLVQQLEDALSGKDHTQGADLPPCEPGRTRFFVDLGPVHAEYLERAAAREQRTPNNMIERIIRIDWAASPDKAGAITLGPGTSMPRADAPKIPITN